MDVDENPAGNHLCPSEDTQSWWSSILDLYHHPRVSSGLVGGPKSQPVAFPLLGTQAQGGFGESPCTPQPLPCSSSGKGGGVRAQLGSAPIPFPPFPINFGLL